MIQIKTDELIEVLLKNVKDKLRNTKYKTIPNPHLVIIQVGENEYSDDKKKACEQVGINCSIYKYDEDITTEKLKNIIYKLSLSPTVTGISIQLPLPEHIDLRALVDELDPNKDVDGITCVQAGMLQLGIEDPCRMDPPESKSIVKLLKTIIYLPEKNVTIISKNTNIDKATAQLLLEKKCKVTLCHCENNLTDIERNTEKSDIIILSTDKPKYFGARYFYRRFNTDPATKFIIDTGISKGENGNLYGDLNTDEINTIQSSDLFYYTTPGLINDLSNIVLLENICIAYEAQFDNIWKYHQMKKMEKENV